MRSTDDPSRCKGCNIEVPEGIELCSGCRTERLLIADLAPPRAPGSSDGDAPLVGRMQELLGLAALAREAVERREVRFFLVTGAPGLGKTRLREELTHTLTARMTPQLRVYHSTVSEGAPPLFAFAQLLRQRFDIQMRDPVQAARDKLLAGVKGLLPESRATETAHLLGDMLGIPFLESPFGLHEGRGQMRPEPRLYLGIKRLLLSDAARGPIALLFDEMEHAPPELVNLLHYLSAGLSGAPVLLGAFSRPELIEAYPAFGQGEVQCARIDLAPLSRADSVAVLRSLTAGAGEVPEKVRSHVEQHLAGSPRAITELIRLLLETGALDLGRREDGADAARGPARPAAAATAPGWNTRRLDKLNLPTDLTGLTSARLFAMEPSARAVLEKAAVCGESFFVDAVVALIRLSEVGLGLFQEASSADSAANIVAPDPDGPTLEEIVVAGDRATHEVNATLRQLTRRGLIAPLPHSTIPGEQQYRFAYPPWREVIYEAMPLSRRRRYHGMLSHWLDLSPAGRSEEVQEAIARHLERAGQGPQAALRYRRAAEAARLRYAHSKATRLFARAIACLGTSDLSTRIQLWHELGAVFQKKGDYDNALSAYEKVVRLSWVVASREKAATALLHMGEIHRQKGEPELARDYLGQARDLFQQIGAQAGVADCLDALGQVLWLLGRYAEALDCSAAALEERRRAGDRRKVAASLLSIGNIERHRGLFDAAESCYREALALHQKEGDKLGVAACHNALGMLAYQRGDPGTARHIWEEALHLAEQVGAAPLQAVLLCHLGEVLLAEGSLAEAEARFAAAQELSRGLSDKRLLSESTRSLGLIALRQGSQKEALRRCELALKLAEESGIQVDIGRALIALGEVHAATLFDETQTREPPAREYFRRGVALFREIGNDAELAEGLARMGRYHIECGNAAAGKALLTEAEAIYTRLNIRRGDKLREVLSEL